MCKVGDYVGVATLHIAPYFGSAIPDIFGHRVDKSFTIRICGHHKGTARAFLIQSPVLTFADVHLKVLEVC